MKSSLAMGALFACLSSLQSTADDGDAAAGGRAFRACAACHAIEPNRSMTGPSLAGVLNRVAGQLPSFPRYSDAMKKSGVIWTEQNLDRYLESPAQFMPGNQMTFAGVPDGKARADIIAFLKSAGIPNSSDHMAQPDQMGTPRAVPNLKSVDASSKIKSITYCRDTFKVTTDDGKSRDFWERNLRLKTDSSDVGPNKGAPAILSAGMMGDRATVIFSSPGEIAQFIKPGC